MSPKAHVRFNAAALGVWLLLAYPTYRWLMDSVPWVVFMSWYAIVVSHLAAYIAAKAEQKADE